MSSHPPKIVACLIKLNVNFLLSIHSNCCKIYMKKFRTSNC